MLSPFVAWLIKIYLWKKETILPTIHYYNSLYVDLHLRQYKSSKNKIDSCLKVKYNPFMWYIIIWFKIDDH